MLQSSPSYLLILFIVTLFTLSSVLIMLIGDLLQDSFIKPE